MECGVEEKDQAEIQAAEIGADKSTRLREERLVSRTTTTPASTCRSAAGRVRRRVVSVSNQASGTLARQLRPSASLSSSSVSLCIDEFSEASAAFNVAVFDRLEDARDVEHAKDCNALGFCSRSSFVLWWTSHQLNRIPGASAKDAKRGLHTCAWKPYVFADSSRTGKLWPERLLACSIKATIFGTSSRGWRCVSRTTVQDWSRNRRLGHGWGTALSTKSHFSRTILARATSGLSGEAASACLSNSISFWFGAKVTP